MPVERNLNEMSLLTPSTRISAFTTLQRTRLLPNFGEVFVRVGQDVNPIQIIAQSLPNGGYFILRASKEIGVPDEELPRYSLVEIGAALRKDNPIIRKQGRFGRTTQVKSPVNGILTDIRNGCMIIQKAQEPTALRAVMFGRVVSIVPNRGAVLETRGALVQALWDSGKDGFGKLKTVVKSAHEPLNADRITGEVRGSILIAGWISTSDDLHRLENSGVRGIIAGSMPAKLCLSASSFSYPIFLTDGVGEQAMSEPIFQILHRSEDKDVSLLSKDDGLRGQGSEIVVPLSSTMQESPSAMGPVEVGKLVRVLRWNGGHLIGRIVRIHEQPSRSDIGLRMPGAEIEYGYGERAFIPYSNLDLIS